GLEARRTLSRSSPESPVPGPADIVSSQHSMRLCRFWKQRLGVVEGAQVRDVTAALDMLPAYRHPFPCHDVLIEHLDALLPRIRELAAVAPAIPIGEVAFMSPVANPGKLIGAPVNYQR